MDEQTRNYLKDRMSKHYGEWLTSLCTPVLIPIEVINRIKEYLSEHQLNMTQSNMRTCLKALRFNEYYDSIPSINIALGVETRLPENLPIEALVGLYQRLYERNLEVHRCKRSLPSPVFVTRKLLETLGCQEHNMVCFPYIKSEAKRKAQEEWWESVKDF